MKVMVVFHLPDELLYCGLDDLSLIPAVKSAYVVGNRLFEVVRPTEILGRMVDGSRVSVNTQLMQLLFALDPAQPQKALSMLAHMRNVGDPQEQPGDRTNSGLIIHRQMDILKNVERIVVLEMKLLSTWKDIDEAALFRGDFVGAVHHATKSGD